VCAGGARYALIDSKCAFCRLVKWKRRADAASLPVSIAARAPLTIEHRLQQHLDSFDIRLARGCGEALCDHLGARDGRRLAVDNNDVLARHFVIEGVENIRLSAWTTLWVAAPARLETGINGRATATYCIWNRGIGFLRRQVFLLHVRNGGEHGAENALESRAKPRQDRS
jgi:hypothetical protein